MQTGTREGLRLSHRPRRLKVSAYYTAQARVNYIALSMDHVHFCNALLRDLLPFAFARHDCGRPGLSVSIPHDVSIAHGHDLLHALARLSCF
jgi:hypothetical protein